MPVESVGNAVPAPVTPSRPLAASARPDFAATLQAHLSEPQDEIAQVRATIAAIRSGRAIATDSTGGGPDISQKLRAWSQRGTGAADPYGWRAMTREVGDQVVGGGFGALFERQIQQESGYDPGVVFGQRRSSAGAEGIAQLMPQFYAGVDRTDPSASLRAAAGSMHHYLSAFDGDVRKALASYNAGMGRVQQLVKAHGAEWERALPQETKEYLAAIVGDAHGAIRPTDGSEAAVFGGRGAGGALSSPLNLVNSRQREGSTLALVAPGRAAVVAPADGTVAAVLNTPSGQSVVIDHGNGWLTTLDGLAGVEVQPGARVARSQAIGVLGGSEDIEAVLRLSVALNGRALDPMLYLIGG